MFCHVTFNDLKPTICMGFKFPDFFHSRVAGNFDTVPEIFNAHDFKVFHVFSVFLWILVILN